MPQLANDTLRCSACNMFRYTTLECKKRKDGYVEFQVHCDGCGTYSHTLPRGNVEKAVETMHTASKSAALRVVRRFEKAVQALSWLGSKPPEEHDEIRKEHEVAKTKLLELLTSKSA